MLDYKFYITKPFDVKCKDGSIYTIEKDSLWTMLGNEYDNARCHDFYFENVETKEGLGVSYDAFIENFRVKGELNNERIR